MCVLNQVNAVTVVDTDIVIIGVMLVIVGIIVQGNLDILHEIMHVEVIMDAIIMDTVICGAIQTWADGTIVRIDFKLILT